MMSKSHIRRRDSSRGIGVGKVHDQRGQKQLLVGHIQFWELVGVIETEGVYRLLEAESKCRKYAGISAHKITLYTRTHVLVFGEA